MSDQINGQKDIKRQKISFPNPRKFVPDKIPEVAQLIEGEIELSDPQSTSNPSKMSCASE